MRAAWTAIALLAAVTPAQAMGNRGAAGTVGAEYRGTPAPYPAIVTVAVRWTEEAGGPGATLVAELGTARGRLGAFRIEGHPDSLLGGLSHVSRYVWQDAAGVSREWRRDPDGAALLPSRSLLAPFLPHRRGDTVEFPASLGLLGRTLPRVEAGPRDAPGDPGPIRTMRLQDDYFIATSRDFRDDGTGRHPESGGRFRRGKGDYRYLPLDRGNYREMIAAGFNLFRIPPAHLPWLEDEPVWFVMEDGFASCPDVIFRGSFLGDVMYMDEPAWRMLDQAAGDPPRSPEDAARRLEDATRAGHEGDGAYGREALDRKLDTAGVATPGAAPIRPSYPVWEAVPSAAWYEVEAGMPGVCLQGRVRPARFAARVGSELGVALPDDAASGLRLDIAWLTGAARRFGAEWGMSVYGQMDSTAAALALPLAYDLGAKWLWVWTSDRDHHVPWSRQLRLVRDLTNHIRAHPRTPGAPAANLAVVIPWGIPFDEFCFDPPGGGSPRLWNSPTMKLPAKSASGVSYRQLLAGIARAAGMALATREPFDFLLLREGEVARGYARVLRVTGAGEVVEDRGGQP